MIAPKADSKPRILCPPGLHLCRLVQVVDLGNQRFQGGDPSRKLYFGFETLETKHTFKEEIGEEPFMLQSEFAFYMVSSGDKKTKLRQFVESWFNKPFPDDDSAASFDFSKLLGRLAGVMAQHTPKKGGGMKCQIVGVCPPESGKAKLDWERENPWVCYEIQNGEDGEFRKLPKFLQDKIRESDEFRAPAQVEEQEPEYQQPDTSAEPVEEDDVPFN